MLGEYSVLTHVLRLLPYQISFCLNLMKVCKHYGAKKHYFSIRVFWGLLDGVSTVVTNLHSNKNCPPFSFVLKNCSASKVTSNPLFLLAIKKNYIKKINHR